MGLETIYAANARDLSLLYALHYIHSAGNLGLLLGTEKCAQALRIVGGMQSLAERLAAGLDVRLGHAVRRIEQTKGRVIVSSDQGRFEAARAIVAIPPTLTASLEFDPVLSPTRAQLIRQMPMGAVIKCTAVYREPFWRRRGLSGQYVSDEGPVPIAFDASPPSGMPGILVGFCEADDARAMGSNAARRSAGRGHSVLRACLRRPRGAPASLLRQSLGARRMGGGRLWCVHATRGAHIRWTCASGSARARSLGGNRDSDPVERLHRRSRLLRQAHGSRGAEGGAR